MTKVKRLDSPITAKTKKLDDGSLVCEARIARAGVYTYVLPNGDISKEYRSATEVFKKAALKSFEIVPLTLNHPASGEVTPDNFRMETRGVVTNVHQDPEAPAYVAATIKIQDAQALNAIEGGTVELSCGYTCTRTPVTGMTVTDELTGETVSINAVLSDIAGNHVALVPSGRAGPGARLILDAQDFGVEMQINDELKDPEAEVEPVVEVPEAVKQDGTFISVGPSNPGLPTPTFSVDPDDAAGDEPTEHDDPAGSVLEPVFTKAQMDACIAQLADACAQRDAFKSKLDQLSTLIAEIQSPQKLDALVAERASVVSKANSHGIKTDALPTEEVRKAVVAKVFPKLKLDAFSTEQVQQLFDSVVSPVDLSPAPKAETTVVIKLESNPVDKAREQQAKRYGLNP